MRDLKNHRASVDELGKRVVRDLVMENTGTVGRRQWWIASAALAITAADHRKAA